MDLSSVSTEDLKAFKSGKLDKVSTEGLMALKDLNAPKAPVEGTGIDAFNRRYNPIAQVGLDDEIAGAVHAGGKALMEGKLPTGEDFQEGKRLRQERSEGLAEQYPGATTAGNVAGAVGMAAMVPVQGVVGNIKAAAGIGGATGFGNAEGDFVERGAAGIKNAVGAGVLSAGMSGLFKAGGVAIDFGKGSISTLRDSMASSADDAIKVAERATQKVVSALDADKVSPKLIERAIKEGNSIFEVVGRRTHNLAETINLYGGEARDRSEQFFRQKAGEAPTKLKGKISEFVSEHFDYETVADDITNAGRKAAGKLYEKAYSQSVKMTEDIQSIIDTPAGQRAYTNAIELMKNEQKDLAKDSFEILDYMKRGFDIEINKYKDTFGRLNLDDNGRAVVTLRSALNSEMKKQNKAYSEAVRVSGDYLGNVEAINRGTKFFKYSPKELKEMYGAFNESEQRSFLAGVAGGLRKKIDDSVTDNVFKKAIPNETVRQQLKSFIPDDDYQALLKSFADEEKFYKLQNDVLGNSKTAARGMYRKSFEADTGFIHSIARDGFRATGRRAVGERIFEMADGLNTKTAEAVSEILYSTDKTKQIQLLEIIKKRAESGDGEAMEALGMYTGFVDALTNVTKQTAKNLGTVIAPVEVTESITE